METAPVVSTSAFLLFTCLVHVYLTIPPRMPYTSLPPHVILTARLDIRCKLGPEGVTGTRPTCILTLQSGDLNHSLQDFSLTFYYTILDLHIPEAIAIES